MSNLIGNAVKLEQQYPPAKVVLNPPQSGTHLENLQPTAPPYNERTDVPFPHRRASPRRRRTHKGHRRHRRGKYDTSSDDDSDASTGTELTDSDQSVQLTRGGVFAHRNGPRHRGLVELQPTNRRFETLLNYRYYSLCLREVRDIKDKMAMIRKNAAYLRYHMKFNFTGEEPIRVLEFLAIMVHERGEAYATLPNFIEGVGPRTILRKDRLRPTPARGQEICWLC